MKTQSHGVAKGVKNMTTNPRRKTSKKGTDGALMELRLYIAGQTPKSLSALSNLRSICESHLSGQYRIEIIDLLKSPQLARGDQILAIPTLVRKLPQPIRRIIGDLSNTQKVLVGLDLRPQESRAKGVPG